MTRKPVIHIHADAKPPRNDADPRYEVTLACGDTVSAHYRPTLGQYRVCIHCDASKRVTAVVDRAEPVPDPTPAPAPDYVDASGCPVTVGSLHWSSDLDLVRVVQVAQWPADREGDVNRDCYCSPWHRTERVSDGATGHYDGGQWGRLATFHPFSGRDARLEV